MRSDVANIQLRQTRKLSYSQFALIVIVLFIASKICTLPSVLAEAAGSKAVWSVMILIAIEWAILFFAMQTAKAGGILSIHLPQGVKIPALLLLLLFFALKITVTSREIATYYALSLFENVPVLPLMIILLFACSLLADKGYATIGKTLEIFVWLFLFVFLFAVIFTRTQGDLFNTIAIFNGDLSGLGKGVYRGLGWFGDSAALAFPDLSGDESVPPSLSSKSTKRGKRLLFAALLFSFLLLSLFFTLFTSVYGDAAKMTDYAFIKLSAFKANTDELGSADWPVIILWAILSTLLLALLLLTGKECLFGLKRTFGKDKKGAALAYLLLGTIAVALAMWILDEEGDYDRFMGKVMNVLTIAAAGVTVAMGSIAMYREKERKLDEKSH